MQWALASKVDACQMYRRNPEWQNENKSLWIGVSSIVWKHNTANTMWHLDTNFQQHLQLSCFVNLLWTFDMTKSCTTHKVHKSCGNMKILCVPVDGAANLKNKHCVLCSVFCAGCAVSPGSRFYLRVNKCSDDEHNICVRCYGEGVKRSNIEHNAATIITCLSDHLADNTAPSVRQSAKYSQSSLAN